MSLLFDQPLLLVSNNVKPNRKRKRNDENLTKPKKTLKHAIELWPLAEGGEASIFASPEFVIFRCENVKEAPSKWLNSNRIVKTCISQQLKHKYLLSQQKHPELTSMTEALSGEFTCSTSEFGIDLGKIADKFAEDFRKSKIDRKTILSCMCAFFTQISNALKYLHEKNLCHRDLKPENIILFDRKTKQSKNSARAKISDFGLLTRMGRQTHVVSTKCRTTYNKSKTLGVDFGTEDFMPFEKTTFQQFDLYGLAVSIVKMTAWSLGVDKDDISSKQKHMDLARSVQREIRHEKQHLPVNVRQVWRIMINAMVKGQEIPTIIKIIKTPPVEQIHDSIQRDKSEVFKKPSVHFKFYTSE